MHFSKVLAISASFITLGLAADPLAFTSWPQDVAAGKPVTLTWAGAVPDQVQKHRHQELAVQRYLYNE